MRYLSMKFLENAKRAIPPKPMTPEDEALGVSEDDVIALSLEDSHLPPKVTGFREDSDDTASVRTPRS